MVVVIVVDGSTGSILDDGDDDEEREEVEVEGDEEKSWAIMELCRLVRYDELMRIKSKKINFV